MTGTSTCRFGAVLLLIAMFAHSAHAALNFVEGPDSAWAYSTRLSGTSSTTFFATDVGQFAGAAFRAKCLILLKS